MSTAGIPAPHPSGLTVEPLERGRLCIAADGHIYARHTWWPNTYECDRCGARNGEPDR